MTCNVIYIVPVFPLSPVGFLSVVLSSLLLVCIPDLPVLTLPAPFGTFASVKIFFVIHNQSCPVPLRMSSCPSPP